MSTLKRRASDALASLSPAYFAMVMATGIVSTACYLEGYARVGRVLFVLNVGLYGLIWGAFLLRAAAHPKRLIADFLDPARSPGFLTFVAATCVLGTEFMAVRSDHETARTLWLLALVVWLPLNYGIFAALITSANKPTMEKSINGGWLVAVVATQAISVLGAMVAPTRRSHQDIVLFVSTVFWMAGGMIYLSLITLIVFRYMFLSLTPSDLCPSGRDAVRVIAAACWST